MSDIETFGMPNNVLYAEQKEYVAKMKAALLSCSKDNLSSATAKSALRNITAMRIYHQISRIIRYLELMDKLEDKLYSSLDYAIDHMDESSSITWSMLLKAQESLQKSMIESHKLLQPYLELQDIEVLDLVPETNQDTNNLSSNLISSDSRERIRSAATELLSQLELIDEEEAKSDSLEGDEDDG